jgi:hypothetical protein
MRKRVKAEVVIRGAQCWVVHTVDYGDVVAHVLALDTGVMVIHAKKGAA